GKVYLHRNVCIHSTVMLHSTSSQEIDQYSQEVPEDVKISPTSDFDIYVKSPDESSFEEADSPAMEYEMKFGHHYTDKQFGFLEVCAQKLNSSHCGDALFTNMVGEGKPVLLAECCGELLRIGKDCYLGTVQVILSRYEYRNIASKTIPKSKQTWNDCVPKENMAKSLHIAMFVSIVMFFTSNSISSQEIDQYSQEAPGDVKISPTSDFDIYVEYPDESSFKEADSSALEAEVKFEHHYTDKQFRFLEVCAQKLTSSHCGDVLFKNMVGEGTPVLLAECCAELLKIGKDCYLGTAQVILSTYEYRNIASKAIPKSKQTWNDCVLMFFTSNSISSQEIDQHSQEAPGDVKISPTSDFDIYVEYPDESSFKEADSPALEAEAKFEHHYADKQFRFLKVCAQKLTSSHCGDVLFKNMVGEGTPVLLAECCAELLKIGKDCYLGTAQVILSTYEYRNIASKAIPKSKQTWNDCVRLTEN
ncbi:unnamed protein product, partial [Brassica rapa subsp. trilocularis]